MSSLSNQELKYETGPGYSMSDVPDGPQIYIANLHHGHSKIKSHWGDKIKKSDKLNTHSESVMGIKLLAWCVKNIKTIFPDHLIDPKFWSGQFETGYLFWSKTTLWQKLENETYISADDINKWAEEELTIKDENSIRIKHKIYDSDNFLGGVKTKKKNINIRKKNKLTIKSVKNNHNTNMSTKKKNLIKKKRVPRKILPRKRSTREVKNKNYKYNTRNTKRKI